MLQCSPQRFAVVLITIAACCATGCAGRGNRKPVATAAPAGRGASVPNASTPPASYYERQDQNYQSAAARAEGPVRTGPVQTFDAPTSTAPTVVAATPGFVGKQVSIHFTASSLSLGTGPRRDIVKGKVLSADGEWVVLQVKDEDKPLYIPRTSVMAIQVE